MLQINLKLYIILYHIQTHQSKGTIVLNLGSPLISFVRATFPFVGIDCADVISETRTSVFRRNLARTSVFRPIRKVKVIDVHVQ